MRHVNRSQAKKLLNRILRVRSSRGSARLPLPALPLLASRRQSAANQKPCAERRASTMKFSRRVQSDVFDALTAARRHLPTENVRRTELGRFSQSLPNLAVRDLVNRLEIFVPSLSRDVREQLPSYSRREGSADDFLSQRASSS
jgi:hypothetical protein